MNSQLHTHSFSIDTQPIIDKIDEVYGQDEEIEELKKEIEKLKAQQSCKCSDCEYDQKLRECCRCSLMEHENIELKKTIVKLHDEMYNIRCLHDGVNEALSKHLNSPLMSENYNLRKKIDELELQLHMMG